MSPTASMLTSSDSLMQALTSFAADPVATALAIIVATLLLEDATAIVVGLLASQTIVEPIPALAALLVGTIVGDVALHLAGRFLGKTARGQHLVKQPSAQRAVRLLKAHSLPTLAAARFVPGLRLPVYFGSGFLRIPFRRCLFLIIATGLIWTPALFWLSAAGGAIAAERLGQAGLFVAPALFGVFALTSFARRLKASSEPVR